MESRSPQHHGGRPVEKSTNEAREGVTGHNVRYVLLFGLTGVLVALAIVYGLFFSR